MNVIWIKKNTKDFIIPNLSLFTLVNWDKIDIYLCLFPSYITYVYTKQIIFLFDINFPFDSVPVSYTGTW